MGGSDSKNEKCWLGKVGRTDRKKWEGLTRKIRTHLGKHWPEKNGKVWVGKVGRTDWKSEKDWLEKWEGLTLNMEGLSQNREGLFQKQVGLVWLEKRSWWNLTAIVKWLLFSPKTTLKNVTRQFLLLHQCYENRTKKISKNQYAE